MCVEKQRIGRPVQTRTISRMWGLVAMLMLLDRAAVARAQDAVPAPAVPRSLAPTPFQLTLPSAHLFGDWYGLRSWLEDHGITPSVTFVTDALGNPTGGREQGFTGAHNLGLDLLFDLEKLAGLRGGKVQRLELDVCDQYTIQGDRFAAAILHATPVPIPLEDAVRNMEVIEAVVTSGAAAAGCGRAAADADCAY